jgi:hypothetical protein
VKPSLRAEWDSQELDQNELLRRKLQGHLFVYALLKRKKEGESQSTM